MTAPDVSLIVPCYNTEKYLAQALESARANDRCKLEIIVLNDGSTDGSLEIMQGFAERDPRFRVIDKPNQGYGASVNRGIDEACGRYVAILEPDDWVEPHMYDDLFELAQETGWPDIVKSAYWRIVEPETPLEHREPCAYLNRIVAKPKKTFNIYDEPAFLRHHPSIWSAIYRRDFLSEHRIRFMEVSGAGWVDNPFMVETLLTADTIVYDNAAYYCYREELAGSSSDMKLSTLPFVRWNDMMDIVERKQVRDRGVLDALYVRIFDQLVPQIDAGGLDDPEVGPAIRSVCERMDPERVRALPVVSPAWKAYYYRVRELPVPKGLGAVFYKERAKEYLGTLAAYGPKTVLERAQKALHRR